jgi:hypothetical protein
MVVMLLSQQSNFGHKPKSFNKIAELECFCEAVVSFVPHV